MLEPLIRFLIEAFFACCPWRKRVGESESARLKRRLGCWLFAAIILILLALWLFVEFSILSKSVDTAP